LCALDDKKRRPLSFAQVAAESLAVPRALVETKVLILPCRNVRGQGRNLIIVSMAKERVWVMGLPALRQAKVWLSLGRKNSRIGKLLMLSLGKGRV
jgi:hypothetical protein